MLTTQNFKQKKMAELITVKILKNVYADNKIVRIGEIHQLAPKVANRLIAYKHAEICEAKPKAKKTAKKKVAKSKPLIDAQR